MSRILILDAHPDPDPARYLHALSASYAEGAREGGHEVVMLQLAALHFPLLQSGADFAAGPPPETIRRVQEQIQWCSHLVIFFPLWLGCMPALLKGLLEQVMRPGFAFTEARRGKLPKKLLAGKSARIVVTMGMPAWWYRWYFHAHSVTALKRNILGFVGVAPIRTAIIGGVEAMGEAGRLRWLQNIRTLGRAAR